MIQAIGNDRYESDLKFLVKWDGHLTSTLFWLRPFSTFGNGHFRVLSNILIILIEGIGYEIVRSLMKSGKFEFVYLTARNVELGEAAVAKLNSEETSKCIFHQLDVTDASSIEKLHQFIGNFQNQHIFSKKVNFWKNTKSKNIPDSMCSFKMQDLHSKEAQQNQEMFKLVKRSKSTFGASWMWWKNSIPSLRRMAE